MCVNENANMYHPYLWTTQCSAFIQIKVVYSQFDWLI